MLYSVLLIIGTGIGVHNVHTWVKLRRVLKECDKLEKENKALKIELAKCNDSYRQSKE